MQFRPEQVYTFVAFVSSVLGMWSILSAKMTKQENRNTVLEKDIENTETEIEVLKGTYRTKE